MVFLEADIWSKAHLKLVFSHRYAVIDELDRLVLQVNVYPHLRLETAFQFGSTLNGVKGILNRFDKKIIESCIAFQNIDNIPVRYCIQQLGVASADTVEWIVTMNTHASPPRCNI